MVRADPTPHRFASLDGLRAGAALAVLVFHVASATGVVRSGDLLSTFTRGLGNTGVGLFFVLSGFLLYRPFATAHLSGSAPRPLRTYFRHRVLRIFPAYWLALVGSVLLLGSAMAYSAQDLVAMATLTDVYLARPYLSTTQVGVAWTLTIELAFYLTLPITAWCIRRIIGGRAVTPQGRVRAQLVGIGVLVAGAWAYRLIAVIGDAQLGSNDGFWLPNYLDWFGAGMVLAVAVAWSDAGGVLPRWVQGLAQRWWACGLAAGWIYVVVSLLRDRVIPDGVSFVPEVDPVVALRFGLTPLVGALLVLPAVLGSTERSPVTRVLRQPLVVWLGMVSYGVYLWHLTWIEWLDETFSVTGFWLTLVLTVALTIPTAAVSWYFVEAPLLRLKSSRRERAAAGGRRDGPPTSGEATATASSDIL